MPDDPSALRDEVAALRAANARLRAAVEAKDTEIAALRAALEAGQARQAEVIWRLELRVAELDRRLGMDSSNSSSPPSKEPLAAKARQGAARRASLRERSPMRRPGGQPGHQGAGLEPVRDPDRAEKADPPAECRSCGAGLAGAEPVNVIRNSGDDGAVLAGSPHVVTVRTPDERLVWYAAMPSRSSEAIKGLGVLDGYHGILVRDDYNGWAQFDARLAGVQQCCQHIARHLKGVHALHTGWQHWAEEVRQILGEAHRAVAEAIAVARTQLDPGLLTDLRERYDSAVHWGEITSRLRDWDDGKNHPGYVLARRLKAKAGQIWLFTRNFAVPWTSNASEQAIKGPKRHQAVSGYWHCLATLARYCRVRSCLVTSRNHGIRPIDAIHAALTGHPWLPAPVSA